MIGSNANKENKKPKPESTPAQEQEQRLDENEIVVQVPISMTITVPIPVKVFQTLVQPITEYTIYDTQRVDALQNKELLAATIQARISSSAAEDVLTQLMFVAMKLKAKHGGLRAYYSGYAGVSAEEELK